jgi:ketosteroid isomerase-like protein
MPASRTEIVRELFDRFDRGGIEEALELIGEDFVASVPPSMSAEPDVYEGHAGARRYFAGFEGFLEDVRFQPQDVIEEGDAVIASIRFAGRGATSGIEVEQSAAVVSRVVDGKVVWMEAHPDVETARAAARGNC